MTTNTDELCLIALGVEEQADIDYLSVLYQPTFGVPFYASVQLCVPCRVMLHIPIDQLDTDDLDGFQHYWKTEKHASPGFSGRILQDVYKLKATNFVNYCDPYTRDGFAVYCKGIYEGKPFRFFTQNPSLKEKKTHWQYLMLMRKALFKLFPNVMAIQAMS